MKFNKPKFWDKKSSFISIVLFPLTLITLIINIIKKKITITKKFNVPIICVGNIYIGGTGKTPLSIFLAKELKKSGRNPVILRKYYKNHIDEHNLIRKNYESLILSNNRIEGVKRSLESDYDSIILDDGFQDYTIKKNLNILCFNQNQLIGNGRVIPSGPLREGLSSLKRAHVVLINGKKDIKFETKILKINKNLDIFYSNYVPMNLSDFKNKKILAVAGIGNPENFFQLMREYKLKIEKKLIFPDHYVFSKLEIENIIKEAERKDYQIVMTEKDYFKIGEYKSNKISYLKVLLKINSQDNLIKKINKLYDKKD